MIEPVRTLPFHVAGCVGALSHRPVPLITEQHHVFPVYLQAKIWSDVNPSRPSTAHVRELAFLCGNCHATVHVVIEAFLQAKPPPHVARKLLGIAVRGWQLYEDAVPK